jgi:protocatechuate 3,4-dioxygenase beta subunit
MSTLPRFLVVAIAVAALAAAWIVLQGPDQPPTMGEPPRDLPSPANPAVEHDEALVAPSSREVAVVEFETQEVLVVDRAGGAIEEPFEFVISGEWPRFHPSEPAVGVPTRPTHPPEPPRIDRTIPLGAGRFRLEGRGVTNGVLFPADPEWCAIEPCMLREWRDEPARLVVARAGWIEGTIRDSAGNPVEAVTVHLTARQRMLRPNGSLDVRATWRSGATRTDAEGRYQLPQIPEGHWTLTARRQGWRPAQADVEAKGEGRATYDVVMDRGPTLRGVVIAEDGAPIPGARVRLVRTALDFRSSEAEMDHARDRAETDDAGAYAFEGVRAGVHEIEVRATGFARSRRAEIEVAEADVELAPLVLLRGQSIAGRIVAGEIDAGAIVLGVRPSQSLPMPMPFDAGDAEMLGGESFGANADATFESPPLAPGNYDLMIESPRHAKAYLSRVAAGTRDLVVELTARGAIEGIAIALETSEPLAEYRVSTSVPLDITAMERFASADRKLETVRAPDGRFRIEGLSAGEYVVTIVAAGYARKEFAAVEVVAGETTRGLIALLEPESAILGRVVQRDGTPVEGAVVTTRHGLDALIPSGLGAALDARSGEDGAFRIGALGPGSYTLNADAADLAPASIGPIRLAGGEVRRDVVIVMARGATIHGLVLDDERRPIDGSMVTAVRIGALKPAMAITEESGHYEMKGLLPGTYNMTSIGRISPTGGMSPDFLSRIETRVVKVEAEETIEVDFVPEVLEGAVTLRGKVTLARQPLAGAILTLTPLELDGDREEAGVMRLASSGEDGSYEIKGVLPGEWTATVQVMESLADATRTSFEFEVGAAPEQTRDFEVSATGIAGTVRDATSGEPLAGIRVAIDALDEGVVLDSFVRRGGGARRAAEVITNSSGGYKASGLAAGRYSLRAGGPSLLGIGNGRYAHSAPREAHASEGALTSGVDFALKPGGIVTGIVRGAGSPLAGASLFAFEEGEAPDPTEPFSTVITGDTGSFQLDGLGDGAWIIAARSEGFAPKWKRHVRVRAGETAEVDLDLVQGAELRVVVHDADGADVTHACSYALLDGSGLDLSKLVTLGSLFTSGAAGRSLGAIAPGTYQVRVAHGEVGKTLDVHHGSSPQTVTIGL